MSDQMQHKIPVPDNRIRLDTLVQLRWLAIAGQSIALLSVYMGLGYSLPLLPTFGLLACSAWLNVILKIRYPSSLRISEFSTSLQLAWDIVQISGLLFLTGGLGNPFAILVLAPVMISATVLSAKNTFYLGLLTIVSVSLLPLFHMPLPWQEGAKFELPPIYYFGLWTALICTLCFMTVYTYSVAKEGRQLADALSATELVLAKEKHLDALDGLATAAAHELGTPLATIYLAAKELREEFEPGDPRRDELDLMFTQANRCRDILKRLTSLSSDGDRNFQEIKVRSLLDDVVSPHRGFGVEITITADGEGPEPITMRDPAIEYGLGNLVENAVDFASGSVNVTAKWNSDTLSITVSDDGPGFAPEILARIGDPYISFRSRSSLGSGTKGGGLGLGFFIAKTLLERTGAKIFYENQGAPRKGALVRASWDRKTLEAKRTVYQEQA
ncbi:MAG: ActS/PrrB/RegB family redox-sensitive histidine kinase [Rhodobacteraceae bacterium]|nr:ActS/PrrB/RegB family redox-sensitive histidine kinase [Paracoccaceae bacterium]